MQEGQGRGRSARLSGGCGATRQLMSRCGESLEGAMSNGY